MKIAKIFLFLITLSLFFVFTRSKYALSASSSNNLHTNTKIYSSNNNDYFYGCNDYADYVDIQPSITVLTHGFGSRGYFWSNNPTINDGKSFALNESSLVYKIFERLGGDATLYIAKSNCKIIDSPGVGAASNNIYNFSLIKYNSLDYLESNGGHPTEMIDDVSKHIIIVFDSNLSGESNNVVYKEFEYIIDTISFQYKQMSGYLPRLNLVGHSRGGITNIMYASDHPYNVASIYSIGTPYNGSKLGRIEALLGLLGYTDGNGNIVNEGVKSIMNNAEMKGIRDKWNAAFKSDVNMNVVTYGSMTSMGLLKRLISDLQTNPKYQQKYGALIDKYIGTIKTIVNIADMNPTLAESCAKKIADLSEYTERWGINLYKAVLNVSKVNIEGDLTTEEVNDIISLMNIFNNEFVIMDDLFIDLDSQFGYGFDDDIEYNGFKRYVKLFVGSDYSENRADCSQPGITHNLEIMNPSIINNISSSIMLGYPNYTPTLLNFNYESISNIGTGKAFSLKNVFSSKLILNAENAKITVYKYDSNNALQKIAETHNSYEFKYKALEQYLFLIEDVGDTSVSLNIINNLVVGNNNNYLEQGDKEVYNVIVDKSGYYLISINNTDVVYSDDTLFKNTNFEYIYLRKDIVKKLYVKNTKNVFSYFCIKIYDPSDITLDDQISIDKNKKVLKFTNQFEFSVSYKLEMTWSTGIEYATIYSEYNVPISSVETKNYEKNYTFTLRSGQSCYIIFSSNNSNIKACVYINERQLRWKINDTVYDSVKILLPRGNNYDIQLLIVSSDGYVEYLSTYIITSSNNFTLSNDLLIIYDDAMIGYDINIYPTKAPDFMLTIEIGLNNNDLEWVEENGDEFYLSWEDIKKFENVIVTISNNKHTNAKLTQDYSGVNIGKFDLTNILPKSIGCSTIHVVSFSLNGHEYVNGENITISDYVVNNLFASGTGSFTDNFIITCRRHLNNIRYAASEYLEDGETKYYIQSDFLIMNNIKVLNWEPIDVAMLSGTIKGIDSNIEIKNMIIEETKSDKHVGFIRKLSGGTIENLKFVDSSIKIKYSDNDKYTYVGTVAGSSVDGTIKNCSVEENCEIITAGCTNDDEKPIKNIFVGGICGLGNRIIDCSSGLTINSFGNIGGVCGYIFGGAVVRCKTSAKITLFHDNVALKDDSDNKSIGGLIGIAYSTNIVDITYEKLEIKYESNGKSTDKKLAPRMGLYIGTAVKLKVNGSLVTENNKNTEFEKFGIVDTGELVKVDNILFITKAYDQKKYTVYVYGKLD